MNRTIEASSSPVPGSGALTWTEEKPKRHGWWWVEWQTMSGPERSVLNVVAGAMGALYVYCPSGYRLVAGTVGWRWAGPLAEPLEPSVAEPLPSAGTQRPGIPDGSPATETRKPGSLK